MKNKNHVINNNFFRMSIVMCVVFCIAIATAQDDINWFADNTPTITDPINERLQRFGIESADSLEARIRSDYILCTGDTGNVSREQLLRWNHRIDTMTMRQDYPQKLRSFVETTGIKVFEVRPCEPIIFHERIERNINEMESLVAAHREMRERFRADSIHVLEELQNRQAGPADILNIPAGMTRRAVRILLERGNIQTVNRPNFLQADNIRFVGITVTIAFHFDANDRYTGYEVETDALGLDMLDPVVRRWAQELTDAFTRRLGDPSETRRVSAGNIREGRLSVLSRWNRKHEENTNTPQVHVGLATFNNLYYAKAVVEY